MSSKPEVVAFVHAKGTSERVSGKNMRILGDRPLFCHAIANAQASKRVDLVVIDSDNPEILRIGQPYGATPLRRPPELATNRATGDDLAFWQASSQPTSRIVVQVIPTSPFISGATIDRAIAMIDELNVDSVAAVLAEPLYLWTNGRPTYFREDGRIPNSSELELTVYETTGLYANRTGFVLRARRRLNTDSCAALPLSRRESIDINTAEDFEFADVFWRGLNRATHPVAERSRAEGVYGF